MSKSNDLSSSDSDTSESSSDTSVANTNTGTSIAPSLPVDPIVPPVPSAAPIVTQELPVVPVVPQVASTPLPAIQVASGLPVIRSISSSASVPIATQDNAVVSEGVKMATLATEPTSTVPSIPLSPSVVNGTNPAQNIVVNLTNQQPLSGCGHCSKGCTMCACGCFFGCMAWYECCCGGMCDCTTVCCEKLWIYCFLCDTENTTCPCSCC